jgi:hypothetical protein
MEIRQLHLPSLLFTGSHTILSQFEDWRPSHTNLIVLGSQTALQLTLTTELTQSQNYVTIDDLPPIISSWRQAPWESFFNWVLAVIVLMQHPFWREDGVVSYEYTWPFDKRMYRTCSALLNILPFALYTTPLVSSSFAKQTMPILPVLYSVTAT